ncbi:hypothetical protein LRB11_05195 [Ectothiorhodospira haloalkaliphila]|uniref:hypothetical protein n=1 Tax=Ectothiorhodospira haloalkaliphila TaxID=421628 RepID=UPI001EE84506|nr:hypothetical protein [Ectothiorhodospira haloalkaliphila]MCG5524326.1 hypothetical protein [Ectothiorhodospira haloalkaliphila]
MFNKTPPSEKNEKDKVRSRPANSPSRERLDQGRRKFALAAGSVPVLFAMANKPLMASAGCDADTPSGHVSTKASGKKGDREGLVCGYSPGYWGNDGKGGQSQDQYLSDNTFLAIFKSNNHIVQRGVHSKDNLTLKQVVNRTYHNPNSLNFRDQGNLARAFVAAYMNAYKNPGYPYYPLDTSRVLEMWRAIDDAPGYYTVSNNVKWYKGDVLLYLQSTWAEEGDKESEYFGDED